MEFLLLFYEFFKTGLFAIGGGLATLPFLYAIADKYTWFDVNMLSDMIAISESTPGPIGINMASYAGYNAGYHVMGFAGGVLGSAIATLALVMPSIIIIIIVAKFLEKFAENKLVKDVFYVLRPAVTALIAVSFVTILQSALLTAKFSFSSISADLFSLPAIILFALLLAASRIWKKLHPVVFIVAAAVIGIVFKM